MRRILIKVISTVATLFLTWLLISFLDWASKNTSVSGSILNIIEITGSMLSFGAGIIIFTKKNRRRFWQWLTLIAAAPLVFIALMLLRSVHPGEVREFMINLDVYAVIEICYSVILGFMGGWSLSHLTDK